MARTHWGSLWKNSCLRNKVTWRFYIYLGSVFLVQSLQRKRGSSAEFRDLKLNFRIYRPSFWVRSRERSRSSFPLKLVSSPGKDPLSRNYNVSKDRIDRTKFGVLKFVAKVALNLVWDVSNSKVKCKIKQFFVIVKTVERMKKCFFIRNMTCEFSEIIFEFFYALAFIID